MNFPGGSDGQESVCQCRRCKRHWFDPWVGKMPWRRKWQPTPVFLPGESHGQRNLAGYSPWGCKESNMTEQLSLCFPCGSAGKESACNAGNLGSISGLGRSPGEGKGYPLQYSGLENSMDRGTWQATVHGVTESDMTERLLHPLSRLDPS